MTATFGSPVAPRAIPQRETGPLASPLAAALDSLRQLADLLCALSDDQYRQNPVGVVRSSLGGHVRHCIDHFEALLAAAATGEIDYDQRERGTAIETDRFAAFAAIRQLELRFVAMDASRLAQPVRVTAMLGGGATVEADSTLGRELLFVLSHTIHHNALIAAMCKTLGVPVSERFGYAPATLAHHDRTACARSALSR